MSKTKELVLAIRDDLSSVIDHWRNRRNNWVRSKVDAITAAVVRWAVSKRVVQDAIADQFSAGTPLCSLLRDAAADAVDGYQFEVDAGEVKGFENEVEKIAGDLIENISDERWFKDVVADAIDTEDVGEQIARNDDSVAMLAEAVIAELDSTGKLDEVEEKIVLRLETRAFGLMPWGPFSVWPRVGPDQGSMHELVRDLPPLN